MKKIYIGSYKDCNCPNKILISKNIVAGSHIPTIDALIPSDDLLNTYGTSQGVISDALFIARYYQENLSKLDAETLYSILDDKAVLVTEDKYGVFSHRHVVAAWLELALGIEVEEVKAMGTTFKPVGNSKYVKNILQNLLDDKEIYKGKQMN